MNEMSVTYLVLLILLVASSELPPYTGLLIEAVSTRFESRLVLRVSATNSRRRETLDFTGEGTLVRG